MGLEELGGSGIFILFMFVRPRDGIIQGKEGRQDGRKKKRKGSIYAHESRYVPRETLCVLLCQSRKKEEEESC